jgi:hypothetical protein
VDLDISGSVRASRGGCSAGGSLDGEFVQVLPESTYLWSVLVHRIAD